MNTLRSAPFVTPPAYALSIGLNTFSSAGVGLMGGVAGALRERRELLGELDARRDQVIDVISARFS
jgi:hypothetical protein